MKVYGIDLGHRDCHVMTLQKGNVCAMLILGSAPVDLLRWICPGCSLAQVTVDDRNPA